ncbi:hypothetical protein RN001_005855 [Aquatica leii]|uniref:Uncharacterized protein n=1 Tax=Aquatica leii TaxID=1421715 RepID=A0AAN7PHL8_9COLE|nr:hypothetical protein RN001_005855 [Aquatica leii]
MASKRGLSDEELQYMLESKDEYLPSEIEYSGDSETEDIGIEEQESEEVNIATTGTSGNTARNAGPKFQWRFDDNFVPPNMNFDNSNSGDCCPSIDAVLQHPFPFNQIEDVIDDIQMHCGVTLLKNVCDELHEQLLTPSTYSRSSLTSLPDPFHEVIDISCTCHYIQNAQVCLEHVGCETVPHVNVKSVESSTADDLCGPVDGYATTPSYHEVCGVKITKELMDEAKEVLKMQRAEETIYLAYDSVYEMWKLCDLIMT